MIECKKIIKEFGQPAQRILHDIDLNIQTGEFVSISGRSGSGKSTLLYIISSLDEPTSGDVVFDGINLKTLNTDQLHRFRNENIGFIFQFHYLLPELTTLENVLLPARNLNRSDEFHDRAIELLKELEIIKEKNKLPSQMSGGQQQRVAIARALLLRPKYIFADEPTGNLDTHNADVVMNILERINRENKTTVVLVTHEPSFAARAKREIYLVDGKVAR